MNRKDIVRIWVPRRFKNYCRQESARQDKKMIDFVDWLSDKLEYDRRKKRNDDPPRLF